MTLREKLIVSRNKAGLSQMELANQLGVSRQAVSRWESGDTTPTMDKLKTHLCILSSKNGRVRSAIVRHLLLAAMLSGMLMMLCCAASANDEPVLSPWAKEEAFAAEEAGILPDALHGDLRGAGNRGQAVWYLVKLTETVLQKELPNTAEGVFPDMENTFFEEKAEKAYSAGIVTGYADGSFGAGNHIRREEYAAMLYRLFQYLERETGKQLIPDDLQTRPYADRKRNLRMGTRCRTCTVRDGHSGRRQPRRLLPRQKCQLGADDRAIPPLLEILHG